MYCFSLNVLKVLKYKWKPSGVEILVCQYCNKYDRLLGAVQTLYIGHGCGWDGT